MFKYFIRGRLEMKRFIATSALLVCIVMLLTLAASAESDMSRLNRERLAVGRELLEMNAQNWQSLLPYYSHDIEYHDPIVDIYGIDVMTEFLYRLIFISSPDLVTTVEEEICIDDMYMASWTMVGSFSGVPYEAKGTTIMKFRSRSTIVYYQRDYYSEGDIMASIPGLDEAIWSFRAYYRCAVDPTFECPFGPPPAATTATAPMDMFNPSSSPRSNWSHIDRVRREIGNYLVQLDADNWPGVIEYLTDDYEYHDPIVDIYGPDTMAAFLGQLFSNSSGLITTIEEEICINGVYMATWTMAGEFNGVPFTAPGMSIALFRPGESKAYYSRDYYTEGDIMVSVPLLDEAVIGFRIFYRCAVDPTFTCPLGPPPSAAGAMDKSTEKEDPRSPAAFELGQNVPNPFNPSTTIFYDIPDGGAQITIRIYDVSGRLVKTLVDGHVPAGAGAVDWNGRNDQGQPMASGIYFYRMTGPSFSEMKKMVLLR
jgi:hypothetical protein